MNIIINTTPRCGRSRCGFLHGRAHQDMNGKPESPASRGGPGQPAQRQLQQGALEAVVRLHLTNCGGGSQGALECLEGRHHLPLGGSMPAWL